jgi:regulator of sirC expression with transglutaminase-like and TPR domain
MQTYVCFIQTPRPIANKIWINQTNIKITPKLQQQSEHKRISAVWKATTDVLQMDPVNSDLAAPPSERLVVLYPKDANAQRERTGAQYRGGAGTIFSRMSDNFNSTTLQCNAVSTPHKNSQARLALKQNLIPDYIKDRG